MLAGGGAKALLPVRRAVVTRTARHERRMVTELETFICKLGLVTAADVIGRAFGFTVLGKSSPLSLNRASTGGVLDLEGFLCACRLHNDFARGRGRAGGAASFGGLRLNFLRAEGRPRVSLARILRTRLDARARRLRVGPLGLLARGHHGVGLWSGLAARLPRVTVVEAFVTFLHNRFVVVVAGQGSGSCAFLYFDVLGRRQHRVGDCLLGSRLLKV